MPIFARILDEKYIKTFFMINPIVKTIELPDGRTITLETGKLAKQADGSVMLRMGNTMLLATVCAAKDAVPGTDFMPLQVEYKEKYSAFGRFPGTLTVENLTGLHPENSHSSRNQTQAIMVSASQRQQDRQHS